MIKKKKTNSLKRVSLEKATPNASSLQKKIALDPKGHKSKDRGKSSKNQKERTHNKPQQRSKSRGPLQQNAREARKSTHEVDEILMKKDLKMLLSKKATKRGKDNEIVPDILKKIEQNCRILRKIDQQQRNASNKRASKQSSSDSKSFKQACFNNKSQLPFNKLIGKSKEVHPEALKSVQKCRYSQQISKQHRKPEKHSIKTGTIDKQTTIEKDAETQLKKNVQREEHRIQKSSKNTNYNSNYNSNQSRNSSSLHNSHGLFSIHQLLSKQHKIEQNSGLDRIQGLIKQQQNNLELSRSQKPHMEIEHFQKSSNFKSPQIQQQKQYQQALNKNEEKTTPHQIKRQKKTTVMQPRQRKESFDDDLLNNADFLQSKQKTMGSFQKSKFYVQPIPPFKGKPQKEDSLAGCQITLIQNNIINDSELIELQL